MSRINKNYYDTPIKWYTKAQLAMMYFPDSPSPEVAVKRLMTWIKNCKGLHDLMKKHNYKPSDKSLSPQVVYDIFEYIGDP